MTSAAGGSRHDGPRVVAVGGGHGLAATLQAVRRYAGSITAVVSVADDGGSSGRLRAAMGVPAPGDVRVCLAALAGGDPMWPRALEHRFAGGELEGHALGNLLLAGLAEATGDFQAAIDEVARLVAAVGRVFPATAEPVVLKAEVGGDGGRSEVEGQQAVQNSSHIFRVSLVPDHPAAPGAALDAIAAAEQVVLGPGSLYTSVLAAVAVPDLRAALAATPARKVYVCNLRPQIPETEGHSVASHVEALRAHGVDVDVVVCHPGALPMGDPPLPPLERHVARPGGLVHDPELLGDVLASLV